MNNKMNLKYNNLKINTNLHDAINTNKTHKGLNSINLGKSNYHSNTNIANEMNTINNIFSSFMINSPVQKNKDAADLLNPRNILKNERIEENKTIMHTPTNKGPIENRKIINFYENNLIYNSDISPNFYHSYDPKSTRNSYKSYDSNKFKTLETSSNMFDDNLKYNIDHNKSNKEEKSKIMTDNSKHTYKSDNTKGRKDLYASYDNNSNKETANKLNIAEDDKNRDSINIMNLIANENYVPLSVKNLNLNFPNYNPSKYSTKSMSNVKAYAANTYQGIVR